MRCNVGRTVSRGRSNENGLIPIHGLAHIADCAIYCMHSYLKSSEDLGSIVKVRSGNRSGTAFASGGLLLY